MQYLKPGYNGQFSKWEKKPENPDKCYIFAIKGFDLYGIYRTNASAADAKNEVMVSFGFQKAK